MGTATTRIAILAAVLATLAWSASLLGGASVGAQQTFTWSNGCVELMDGTEAQCPLADAPGWWEDEVDVNGQWTLFYYLFPYADGGYLVRVPNGNEVRVYADGSVTYLDVNASFNVDSQDWMSRMDGGGQTDLNTWLVDTSGWSVAHIGAIFGGILNQRWMAITCTTPGYTCD